MNDVIRQLDSLAEFLQVSLGELDDSVTEEATTLHRAKLIIGDAVLRLHGLRR